jgi:hypothetical protein
MSSYPPDQFVLTNIGHNMDYMLPFCRGPVIAALIEGKAFVAEVDENPKKVVGVALWFPPGADMFHGFGILASTFHFRSMLISIFQSQGRTRGEGTDSHAERLAVRHP